MHRNTRLALLVVGSLLAIQLLGLQPTAANENRENIMVGSHLPLSGALASIGVEQKWAYEAAVKDINENGGIYIKEHGRKLPVALTIIDDESDPGRAAAAVETLIKHDHVDMILSGHSGPYGVIPGCVAAEKNRKYYHATGCFIPPWLDHQFQWSTLFFFDIVELAAAPFKLLNLLNANERPKKIAVLMEDTFDGRALGGIIHDQGKKYGYSFALEDALSPGAKDYSAQILKAKELGVDVILFFAATEDCVTFIRQMKENKFSVKYMQGWKGMWPAGFWKILGEDAQYLISDGHWSMDYPFPGSRELGERYFQEFGQYSVSVGAFYALAQILWQAIEKAGSLDSAKIRRAVIENDFVTVMGQTYYDEMGVSIYPAPVFQWIDGKQKILTPPEVSNHKLQLAPPWHKR